MSTAGGRVEAGVPVVAVRAETPFQRIANGFEYMLSGRYWISFFPGVALLLTIVSINLVGDRLRDVLNPRLER